MRSKPHRRSLITIIIDIIYIIGRVTCWTSSFRGPRWRPALPETTRPGRRGTSAAVFFTSGLRRAHVEECEENGPKLWILLERNSRASPQSPRTAHAAFVSPSSFARSEPRSSADIALVASRKGASDPIIGWRCRAASRDSRKQRSLRKPWVVNAAEHTSVGEAASVQRSGHRLCLSRHQSGP